MKRSVLVLAILISGVSFFAAAENQARFRIDVRPYEQRSLPLPTYVFVTHPTSTFDIDSASKAGLTPLLKWAREKRIPKVLLFSGSENDQYYFAGSNDFDLTVESVSGAHRLGFQDLRSIVVGGGNFGLCLCETLRDLIRGSGSKPLNIVVATDATYDSLYGLKEASTGRLHRKIVEDSNLSYSLEEIREMSSKEEFLELLRVRLTRGNTICPKSPAELEKTRITLRIDDVATSVGPNDGRPITVHFLKTDQLDSFAR